VPSLEGPFLDDLLEPVSTTFSRPPEGCFEAVKRVVEETDRLEAVSGIVSKGVLKTVFKAV
jgi:hypothetical protein